jgi:peptide/nickel transport system permease protein
VHVRSLQFIAQRILTLIPVILGVIVVTFVIGYVVPADPVYLFIGQDDDAATIERVRSELGLDQPVHVQFFRYVRDFVRGDWGMSWSTQNPVMFDLQRRLPATAELVLVSLLITIVFAFPFGVISATWRDTLPDHISRVVSLIGVAIPNFWLGLLLIYFLFATIPIFPPPMGRVAMGTNVEFVTGFMLIDTLLAGNRAAFWSAVSHLVLPVFTLAFSNLAQLMRLVRASMIEALAADYTTAARAQGLRGTLINGRLALRNSLLAPVTQIGLMAGHLIGGAVIIEIVFAWPGMGSWAIDGAMAGDFGPVRALAVLAAFTRVIIFLLVDIAYTVIDPRISYQ